MDSKRTELTPYEERVLRLVACGLSNKEIALRVKRTSRSVRDSLVFVFDIIEVPNRTRATLWALRNKLLSVDQAWNVREHRQETT